MKYNFTHVNSWAMLLKFCKHGYGDGARPILPPYPTPATIPPLYLSTPSTSIIITHHPTTLHHILLLQQQYTHDSTTTPSYPLTSTTIYNHHSTTPSPPSVPLTNLILNLSVKCHFSVSLRLQI